MKIIIRLNLAVIICTLFFLAIGPTSANESEMIPGRPPVCNATDYVNFFDGVADPFRIVLGGLGELGRRGAFDDCWSNVERRLFRTGTFSYYLGLLAVFIVFLKYPNIKQFFLNSGEHKNDINKSDDDLRIINEMLDDRGSQHKTLQLNAAKKVILFRNCKPWHREMAANILSQHADEVVVDILLKAINDISPTVRISVISALGNINNRKAVPALFALVKDEKKLVKDEAVKVLVKLTGKNFSQDSLAWIEWWKLYDNGQLIEASIVEKNYIFNYLTPEDEKYTLLAPAYIQKYHLSENKLEKMIAVGSVKAMYKDSELYILDQKPK